MGMKLFSDKNPTPPNPNPKRFKVIHEYVRNGYLVLTVKYPDCTTFEGTKVCVYYGYTSSRHLLQYTGGELDPHFQEHGPSPVARFPATKQGHADASLFVTSSVRL